MPKYASFLRKTQCRDKDIYIYLLCYKLFSVFNVIAKIIALLKKKKKNGWTKNTQKLLNICIPPRNLEFAGPQKHQIFSLSLCVHPIKLCVCLQNVCDGNNMWWVGKVFGWNNSLGETRNIFV